ncbi:MAG: glycosyltransferase family 39 protein [Solirubrobacterales bacterium]
MNQVETAREPAAGRTAPGRTGRARAVGPRAVLAVVVALTLLGLGLRLLKLWDSVYADELSTLYIVKERSLGDAIGLVSSDAEVTPPLSFIASWLFAKLGSAPELIRLPSLIAGIVTIPLTFVVGRRAMNEVVGMIGAAIVAISPFMIYFSTEARGYALAIVFLLASTWMLLRGVDTGERRWWLGYAVFSALAMYSHYTAAFPLIAQLLWVLFAFPGARVPALSSNFGALLLYLPWAGGALDDRASPTIKLVEAFVASDLGQKVSALESWTFGSPYLPAGEFPGTWVVAVGIAGIAGAAIGAVLGRLRAGRLTPRPATDHGFALLLLLGLSTPALELLLGLLGGPSVFGSRNLGTASAGAALMIGAFVSVAGAVWGGIALATVLTALVAASAMNLGPGAAKPDFDGAARWIDARARPGDVVVDVFDLRSTPVPLTPLDTYIESGRETFRPSMPVGPPPFLPFISEPPPPAQLIDQALSSAGNRGRIFVVGLQDRMITSGSGLTGIEIGPAADPASEVFELPASAHTVASTELPGVQDLDLFLIDGSKPGGHGP